MITLALAWLQFSDSGAGEWALYSKLMIALCATSLVVLLFVRSWLAKVSGPGRHASGPIRVFARFLLEPRKTLYVVGVGKNTMLLASSEAGVQLMATLNSEDWSETGELVCDGSPLYDKFAKLVASVRTGRK